MAIPTKSKLSTVRREIAAFVVVGSFVFGMILLLVDSFAEERVDLLLGLRGLGFHVKQYSVVIDSLDPDLGFAKAHVVLTVDKLGVSTLPGVPFGSQVVHGPMMFEDLGDAFSAAGLSLVQLRHPAPDRPSDSYTLEPPAVVDTELRAIGNPALYPFDEYLILGRVSNESFAIWKDKTMSARIADQSCRVDFRVAGFHVREATGPELEGWPTTLSNLRSYARSKQSDFQWKEEKYDPSAWNRNQFAIIAERPRFLRVTTLFLAAVAISSFLLIALASDLRQLGFNSVGYFLSLWAVRSALSAGGPRTATLIDYGVISLYGGLVAVILARLIWGFERSQSPRPAKD